MSNKKIGLWDLVFMNVSALYGIRWIAKSTASSFGLGLGAIPTWILFAFIFFVPSALICAELASKYPKDGGLYEWVKEAYGEKWGFIVSWLNWTAKIFWYSSFLTFMSVNISYAVGKPELAEDKMFVLIVSLVVFWVLSLISLKGMGSAKIFTNLGALGSTVPTLLLIVLAFVAVFVFKVRPASVYTVSTMTPKINVNSLSAISSIMFALAGAEVSANFVTEMDNPRRDFPKAIMIAAAIVGGLYVLGSIAITMILPTDQITASQGVLAAISAVAQNLGIGKWLVSLVALGVTISIFGAVILYIASPLKMLFGSVPEGIFPQSMTKVNDINIPYNSVIIQAILVSALLIFSNLLPSVDAIYNLLVTMTALTSLFPYVLLFASYITLRKTRGSNPEFYEMSGNSSTAVHIAQMVLVVTVVGIILSATPVMPSLKENIIYEVEMLGGAVIVIGLGFLLWNRYARRTGNMGNVDIKH